MRLLTHDSFGKLSTTRDIPEDDVPPYAILSHTWGKDEVMYDEVGTAVGSSKAGFKKIGFCGYQAQRAGCYHFWVDTCCIDRTNHVELSKAITCMYQWYQKAQVCLVYLEDVFPSPDGGEDGQSSDYLTSYALESSFRNSRWFTRGWTLQELLAPAEVIFYSGDGERLGTKKELKGLIHEITGIPISALEGYPMSQFPVVERMRWTRGRNTTVKEDQAYCLLGIFDVFMPLIYGEGDNAFRRLQKEIDDQVHSRPVVHSPNPSVDKVRLLGLCLTSAPLIPAGNFIGRSAEINAIHQILKSAKSPPEQRRVVLGGIGGMGKTQLAIAYARQREDSYTSVLWLKANTELTCYDSLRTVARVLSTAEQSERLENDSVLTLVHRWLSRVDNTGWLLIFDNYDNPDQYEIDKFLPNVSHGSIIITTRLPGRVTGTQLRLQPIQATDTTLEILRTRSGRENVVEDKSACTLAQRLGGLPLALATVGAYLKRSAISFQQYLTIYERCWQADHRWPLHLQDYRTQTLYTTWDLSYSRLKEEHPEAAQMLKLLAYFDNQAIWYELLQAGLSSQSSEWLLTNLTQHMSFESVIGTLVDYCLVEVQHSTQSYSMHVAVHDWTLGILNADIDPQLYWYTFDCVAASIKDVEKEALGGLRFNRIGRHSIRLLHQRFSELYELDDNFAQRLSGALKIALLLESQLHAAEAEKMYDRTLAACVRTLGPEHLLTFSTINELGRLYMSQDRLNEAEKLYVPALTQMRTVLGNHHATTLDTIHNSGNLMYKRDDLPLAEKMFIEAKCGREVTFGAEHKSTLSSIHNLARVCRKRFKLAEAESLYLCTMAGRIKTLGPEHISTLDTFDGIGHLYVVQGKMDEAEKMFNQALVGTEKVRGPDHISTLSTVHSLADLYRDQGRNQEAEKMYDRALAGIERTRGADHTATLDVIHSLGMLYVNQKRYDEAEKMYFRALAGSEKTRGPEHTATLDTVHQLGSLYNQQKKFVEAEAMYERALIGTEASYGPWHNSTLATVHNLGLNYLDQGRHSKAEEMFLRALTGYETEQGPKFSGSRDAMQALIYLYEIEGRNSEAEQMRRRRDPDKYVSAASN